MELFANIWYIWLLAWIICFGFAIFKDFQIINSILKDDHFSFELTIYRRIKNYGISLVLSLVFLALLIISGIANLILWLVD